MGKKNRLGTHLMFVVFLLIIIIYLQAAVTCRKINIIINYLKLQKLQYYTYCRMSAGEGHLLKSNFVILRNLAQYEN